MAEKSASEQLHGLLMQEDVGYKFTKYSLETMVSDAVVDVVMDECAKYIATQYGIAALFNPIDRKRIKAAILATMENE